MMEMKRYTNYTEYNSMANPYCVVWIKVHSNHKK